MSQPVAGRARTTTSFRPYDGRPVGSVADTPADVVRAVVEQAVDAAPAVAGVAPARRRDWLRAVADGVERHAEELIALADEETGLGVARLTSEVARCADQLRFYGEVAAEGSYLGVTVDGATAASPRLVRVNQPLGPVAVFGASNFPFAFSVLGNDTASALAAGCPVVVKAHPAHVTLSVRLALIAEGALRAAGAPEGTFALVTGREAGVDLVRAEGVAAVAFTGSQAGGLALWRLANERERVIPVYAEMGTVNPVVVTRAAAASRMEDVARGFVGSFTLGAGQFCTKPGLLLVPAGHDAARVVGDALAQAAPRSVMLTEEIAASVERGLGDLVAAGAAVVRDVPGADGGWGARAAVLSAPISALRTGSRLLEECFGAVALVVEYADEREVRAALGVLQGSLAGTVVTGDDADPDAPWLVEALTRTVGRVTVNDWPTGVAYTWAQQHGGPWPATSNAAATSVGAAALDRFVRPVTYQSAPDAWLPLAARADNPWGLPRRVDGRREDQRGER
ncbi:aldehyde dehydrogenase family protein [Streptomyces sp. NPDC052051]|uniref:aldehyde dehydrogenase family protein n=1 Tax=Streptomyces sp. NPDC052051 TaxID=3154649 RepID=UPI0034407C8C